MGGRRGSLPARPLQLRAAGCPQGLLRVAWKLPFPAFLALARAARRLEGWAAERGPGVAGRSERRSPRASPECGVVGELAGAGGRQGRAQRGRRSRWSAAPVSALSLKARPRRLAL